MEIGKRNGKLITVQKLGGRPCLWRCLCDCGKEKIVKDIHLYSEKGVTSCGCVGKKRFGKDRFNKDFILERIQVNENDCWIWKGAKHKQGYGNVRFLGKTELSHRIAWKIYNGEIPISLKVCHKCDVTSCCNPQHLFLGTQKLNVEDAVKKGKFINRKVGRKKTKLNFNQVEEIKELEKKGISRKKICELFQVGQTCIAKILTGKSWKVNWTEKK